jgi:hypothetical protein
VKRSTIIKLVIFNIALFIVNIAVFSNAFLKVRLFGDSLLETLIGIAVILCSVFLFIFINMRLIWGRPAKIDPTQTVDKITDLDSCHNTIVHLNYSGTFSAKLDEVLEQIQKMQKKKGLIKDILLQKFSDTEMSYGKFAGNVDSAEKIMCVNIKSMLNKICAFDEEEYNEIKNGKSDLRQSIAVQKMEIYNEYIDFVNQAVDGNDEILLRLDKLLLEISKFNTLNAGELENMEAMHALDDLIRDTKWYK